MQAEIIAIGDELSSGQRLDTNSQWLSKKLGDLGIRVAFHTTVGDDLSENIAALRAAAGRSNFVICTGGLGPTLDDLTRQAMADAFDRPLELDEPSLRYIQALFAKRRREMPERNRIQAMFPAGSQIIENPHGSAPGIDLTIEGDGKSSRFFALPGVPAEMKEMWELTVAPRIASQAGNAQGSMRYHVIKLFGIGESDVELKIPTVTQRGRVPAVGITVSRATITLRIAARSTSEEQFRELIQPTVDEIHEALGELIFGEGDAELHDVVVRLLREQNKTLATLEIGAGSQVAGWLLSADPDGATSSGNLSVANVSTATKWIEGQDDLDLKSDESLIAHVESLANQQQSDLALLIARYPSPEEMLESRNAFPLCFALTDGKQSKVFRRSMGGHPDVLVPRIGKTGLEHLRRMLLGMDDASMA